MTGKTLKHLRCRCGHDKGQHKREEQKDLTWWTWCSGDCGCSMFEPLHEPDPPYAPTLVGPLPTWIAQVAENTAIASFIHAITDRH